ncbi:MAG: glycosyltransferase family 39 protein [Verrucomicrobia bacterium]|nr:glycosyltransferase family 39 protein [Verrucomicrobiota bacterium]
MTATLLAGLGVAWTLGVLLVAAVWPRSRMLAADGAVILPLGLGVGLGATSVLFFVASLVVRQPVAIAALGEAVAIAGLTWWLWRRRAVEDTSGTRRDASSTTGWVAWVVGSILAQAGVVAAVVARRAWAAEPWGAWDGWAIWNMRARFIARAGTAWTDALRFTELGWSHLDYPLLVPASVARAWAWGGGESAAAAGLVSVSFGAATVALLVAVVARLRGVLVAGIGGLVLLGTPFFVTFSANEHADIPLGFFVLATMALVALSGREPASRGWTVLAGVTAGLAAWTKNEGVMFAVIVLAGGAVAAGRRGEWRTVRALAAGAAAALVPVGYFKLALAPGNDLVSGTLAARLAQLVSPERHAEIAAALWRDGGGFGEWRVLPFVAMALALATPGARRLVGRERAVAWLLALTLAGYYAVYLITPWDLASHLASSLPRLLVQLWPGAVLWWCLLAGTAVDGAKGGARPPGGLGAGGAHAADQAGPEVRPHPQTSGDILAAPSGWKLSRGFAAAVCAANAAVALAGGWWFARQLAPGEEAAARVAGGAVSVVAGEGWFGRERHGRNTWRWSPGRGELKLHVEARRGMARAGLGFALRSITARTVAVTLDGREVWRGEAGPKQTPVVIPDVALRPGISTLVFASEAPPVREAADPGARALGFAVYDLRVE